MTASPSPNPADRQAVELAEATIARHRAEVELVASIARSPRCSLALLAELRFGAAAVANLDALAIFLAIRDGAAAPGPVNPTAIARLARELLAAVGYWDDSPPEHCPGADLWRAETLATLLTAVPFDPDTIRAAVERLVQADQRQTAAIAAATPKARAA